MYCGQVKVEAWFNGSPTEAILWVSVEPEGEDWLFDDALEWKYYSLNFRNQECWEHERGEDDSTKEQKICFWAPSSESYKSGENVGAFWKQRRLLRNLLYGMYKRDPKNSHLVDHVVEHWCDSEDRDLWESHAENSVKSDHWSKVKRNYNNNYENQYHHYHN